MIPVVTLGSTITKTITIPVVSPTVSVSGVVTTLTIPSGWAIKSGTPSLGTLTGVVWTIPTLPATLAATLELELEAVVDCPTESGLTATIVVSDPNANCNITNDVAVAELLFITCCQLENCNPGIDLTLVVDDDTPPAPSTDLSLEVV